MRKWIGITLVCAASVFIGLWWVLGLKQENTALKAERATQELRIAALQAGIARSEVAVATSLKAAQEARTQSREALRKLRDANTKEDTDWKSGIIPAGVIDSLR